MTTSGIIFDIKRYSINDGPGIRTTIFFKGCPLNCLWCHNPESISFYPQLMHRFSRCIHCNKCVEACPEQAIVDTGQNIKIAWEKCTACGACVAVCPSGAMELIGKTVSVEEVIQEISKDIIFFDQSGGGVTFCGGEPLAQPVFLKELLLRCRAIDIHTIVDTSCYAPRETIQSIMDYVDLFLCDIKHPDSDKHKQLTGVENTIILDNIHYLANNGRTIMIRIPIIPNFNDSTDVIENIGLIVKKMNSIRHIALLPYNNAGQHKAVRLGKHYLMDNVPEASDSKVKSLALSLETMGFEVTIGG